MLERFSMTVNEHTTVSAVAKLPSRATSCFVFAHGAGAGMDHPYMQEVADGLESQRIATLRYQFPFMEKHSGRPDRPQLCHETVRAAVTTANDIMAGLPVIAGGKSFGGRMTSQAQSISPLANVKGLCFFWISSACAQSAVVMSSEAPNGGQRANAFSPGNSRCVSRVESDVFGGSYVGISHSRTCRACRPRFSCARPQRRYGRASHASDARSICAVDPCSARTGLTMNRRHSSNGGRVHSGRKAQAPGESQPGLARLLSVQAKQT